MYAAWTLATLSVAGYGIASAVWQLMIVSLVFNAFETAGFIVWSTAKQRHVPPHLLGRVSSLDWLISTGLLPLSFALTGPVSAALGARTTLIAAGVLGATVTLAALVLPGMRDIEGDFPASTPTWACRRKNMTPLGAPDPRSSGASGRSRTAELGKRSARVGGMAGASAHAEGGISTSVAAFAGSPSAYAYAIVSVALRQG